MKTKFYWHVHHDILVEPLTEPIKNRIAYIKTQKPEHERELRLRLMKPVKGKLPAASVKAGAASVKAWADNMPAIEALHAKECKNCPWDGKTIFAAPAEERGK